MNYNFFSKKNLLFVFFLAVTLFANNKNVPAGYGFTVRVENEINAHNYTQPLVLIVVDDVINPITKKKIIAKNTPVRGMIQYQKNKSAGVPGKLLLQLTHVRAIDGQNILLQGDFHAIGDDKMEHVLGIGIGVGVIFPPMLFYMLKKGGEPVITRGTEFLGTFLNEVK